MSNRKIGFIVGIVLLSVAAAWPVYAHCGRCAASANDMLNKMEASKMTLAKAIEIAEKESKGKAVAAFCELEKSDLVMNVVCVLQNQIKRVELNGTTGKITKVQVLEKLPPYHGGHGEETLRYTCRMHPQVIKEAPADCPICGMKLMPFKASEPEDDAGGNKQDGASKEQTSGPAGAEIDRTVEAGCGSCIFKMEGVQGCKLAVKFDGKAYLVSGANVDAGCAAHPRRRKFAGNSKVMRSPQPALS